MAMAAMDAAVPRSHRGGPEVHSPLGLARARVADGRRPTVGPRHVLRGERLGEVVEDGLKDGEIHG